MHGDRLDLELIGAEQRVRERMLVVELVVGVRVDDDPRPFAADLPIDGTSVAGRRVEPDGAVLRTDVGNVEQRTTVSRFRRALSVGTRRGQQLKNERESKWLRPRHATPRA